MRGRIEPRIETLIDDAAGAPRPQSEASRLPAHASERRCRVGFPPARATIRPMTSSPRKHLAIPPQCSGSPNVIELFERAAYYGVLHRARGFPDERRRIHRHPGGLGRRVVRGADLHHAVRHGRDLGPHRVPAGADHRVCAADRGVRAVVDRAAALPVIVGLVLAAIGGSFVKPLITGTVTLCSTEVSRARAFSLFYMLVNVGSFSGKSVAGPVRQMLGVGTVPLYSAGAAAIALLIAIFLPAARQRGTRPRSLADIAERSGHGVAQRPVHGAGPDHGRVLADPGADVRVDAEVRPAHGGRCRDARSGTPTSTRWSWCCASFR